MIITRKQQDTFEFIKDFMLRHQCAPTMAEIAEGIGIKSRGVVHRYVQALSEAGVLRVIPGKRRNIELVNDGDGSSIMGGLPLLGKIAAGQPIEAIHSNETIDIAYALLGNERYALRVKGDSMIDEGIFDGDLVICEHSQTARNGEIVVALVHHDSATLKRFYNNQNGTVTLRPANSALSDMTYPANDVEVQGLMIGLLRMSDL